MPSNGFCALEIVGAPTQKPVGYRCLIHIGDVAEEIADSPVQRDLSKKRLGIEFESKDDLIATIFGSLGRYVSKYTVKLSDCRIF